MIWAMMMMRMKKTTSGNPADEMDFYPKTGHNEQEQTSKREGVRERVRERMRD